jgi:uncharacterized protein (DUF362 family)
MRMKSRTVLRYGLSLAALVVWLWWDLSQAHNAGRPAYQPFSDARLATPKSPAATTVAIVRSNDQALTNPCPVADEGLSYTTVSQMVRRAVDLAGGLTAIIKSGDTVLIKPNLVQQDSSGSGGVTDVRVVKALVYLIDEIDHGHIAIIVGDGSPRPFSTFEKASGTTQKSWKQLFDVSGYQTLKTEALAAGISFRLSNLNGNSETAPWGELDTVAVPGGGTADPQGGKYFVHRDVVRANVYISVPVMKIHKEPGFTGALKNQVGIAASTRYGFNKTTGVTQDGRAHKLLHLAQAPYTWQDQEIVDLSSIAGIDFVVVDALACLESDKSPKYTADSSNVNITNRVRMNTIMAGVDPVAVDHVCCRIMGLNPDDIEHITLAERVGLGTNNPDSITVVGASIDQTKRRFKKGQTWSAMFGQSNRTWLLNGPYSAAGIADPMNYAFIPDDARLSAEPGVAGWSQPVYFAHDQIMLNDYYASKGASTSNVVSYAFSYFMVPADQRAELWVGSDEAMTVNVNGEKVYAYSGTRSFAGIECYKDTVSISLHKGRNKVLVKVLQSTGTYNFTVNICEPEPDILYRGNRVWGLKFTTDPGPVNSVTPTPVPSAFRLDQNYPNPFNPTTKLRYVVGGVVAPSGASSSGVEGPAGNRVRLAVYDLLGREVVVLVDGSMAPGKYEVGFDGTRHASGIYFVRMTAAGFAQMQKMLLVK